METTTDAEKAGASEGEEIDLAVEELEAVITVAWEWGWSP